MKICFPVRKDEGLESSVHDHFGSAPVFLVVDTEADIIGAVPNPHIFHRQGTCMSFKVLAGMKIDKVVVGNIGTGAMMKFIADSVQVYKSAAPTVRENLELLMAGKLREFNLERACPGSKKGCSYL